jgi:hypothetical protein
MAAKKKDPSITFLNKWGYNVIRLPRTGIELLDVIGRDAQSMEWLGHIDEIWTSTNAAPVPGPPNHAVPINGQRTDGLDVSFGVSVLAHVLEMFGASAPSLNLAFKNAHAVQFTYNNVTSTSISPFAAGNYLASGTLRSDNPKVKSLFGSGKPGAYLILDVLKSNSIAVTATDSHGAEVGIDLPHIEGIADAKVGVKPSGSSNSTITFSGPVELVFGFKVQEIARVGESWTLKNADASGALAFGADFGEEESDEPNPMVFDTGDFDCRLDLKMPR